MTLAGDIVDSVVAHGFRRVLIVNGHGGNSAVVDLLAATLGHRHVGKARIASVTYFRLASEAIARLRESKIGGMGHAGEFETAMMLHVAPDLVKMERATSKYPDRGSDYLSTDLLVPSRAAAYVDFGEVSETGVFGDPTVASPEKGALFFAAVAEALARFIEDFAGWSMERTAQ
jgi:creatinine amidohydrolase